MNQKTSSLQSSASSLFLWGIDLGGTKIEAAIIDRTHPDISGAEVLLELL